VASIHCIHNAAGSGVRSFHLVDKATEQRIILPQNNQTPRCPQHGTPLGNAFQRAGTATQRAGGVIALTGAAASIPALGLPPAEIGTLSVTGVGGLVAVGGTALSGIGSAINYFGTRNVSDLAIDAATTLIGFVGGRQVIAGSTIRGVAIGEAAGTAGDIAKMCY